MTLKNNNKTYFNMAYLVTAVLCLILGYYSTPTHGQKSYHNESKLIKDILGPDSGYNTVIRPVLDQSDILRVNVTFYLVAIVEIDAIKQQFVVNGFVGTVWTDEMLRWNPDDYGGITVIYPNPDQFWRPRMILSNTLGARDLFEDLQSPTFVRYNGQAGWYPGSLFPTSCKLNLYKFPYDVQNCYIQLMMNGRGLKDVLFIPADGEVGMDHYVKSGEWILDKTSIVSSDDPNSVSSFRVNFQLRRRPGYFVINIVTPVVLLSFLNILVFLIPGESGEKISYGITVLLAVSVFMGAVSGHLPRSSDTLPLVTIYLLTLIIVSVGTVIVSILTVSFYHKEEKQTQHNKATSNYKSLLRKSTVLSQAASAFKDAGSSSISKNQVSTLDLSDDSPDKMTATDRSQIILNMMREWKENNSASACPLEAQMTGCDASVNRWRQIGKHINCISFLIFMGIWVSVTIGFLVEISR